jgi:dTDP-4-amino-4,6-dideoxygalactose transaminase
MVAELETRVAAIAGVAHAIAVSSGTTALVSALQALRHLGRVKAGDEIITSAFTFVATLNAALQVDLKVRFADIGDDFCIDPASVRGKLTDRTKIVMPVHLYGLPADMSGIAEALSGRDVSIVEDAAQSLGAQFQGRPTGSFGIGCFSLYATKNVTSGEGGVLTTDDDEVAEFLRLLRNQGMADRYRYEIVGNNYRMTDLQAAVAVGQLRRFEAIDAARRHHAEQLAALLKDVPGILVPKEPLGRQSAWHQFTIRVTPDASVTRDDLAAALNAAGIGTGVYYPRAVYAYSCFDGLQNVVHDEVPVTRAYAGQVLSLPIHPLLKDDDLERIAMTIRTSLHA